MRYRILATVAFVLVAIAVPAQAAVRDDGLGEAAATAAAGIVVAETQQEREARMRRLCLGPYKNTPRCEEGADAGAAASGEGEPVPEEEQAVDCEGDECLESSTDTTDDLAAGSSGADAGEESLATPAATQPAQQQPAPSLRIQQGWEEEELQP